MATLAASPATTARASLRRASPLRAWFSTSSSSAIGGCCRLYASKPASSQSSSAAGGSGGEVDLTPPQPPQKPKGAPVYVTLPADVVSPASGRVTRRKVMDAAFRALAVGGVEGVAFECWWGVVERTKPGEYDWSGYVDLAEMARRHGLKVRAILAFHQFGSGEDDPLWISLPKWVLYEMHKQPDLAYMNQHKRRNMEYISLGCDLWHVLDSRSPLQAYSDFMRSFRDTFADFLRVTVTEVQVGMGPGGELRYPSCSSEKLYKPGILPELGEFQCYDKFMQQLLLDYAENKGRLAWGVGGPMGTTDPYHNPENTAFFKADSGHWDSDYGRFFLLWYSQMLLVHCSILCADATAVFSGTGITISAKVAAVYRHYLTASHPSALTAGYYDTSHRNGYLEIAQIFAKHNVTMCCGGFDLRDEEEIASTSSPEGAISRILSSARQSGLSVNGENTTAQLDRPSLDQVIKNCRLFLDGASAVSAISFNFVRMDRSMFDLPNWERFTRFVKQMSDTRTFFCRLDMRRRQSCIPRVPALPLVRACSNC